MTKKPSKTPKQELKARIKDEALITIATNNPGLSNKQIGKQAKDLNIIGHENTIYKRLRESDYLSAEIEKVRANNQEFIDRKILPKALKMHEKVLVDNKKTPENAKEWVFQAERMGLQDNTPVEPVSLVNIESIQVLVADSLRRD